MSTKTLIQTISVGVGGAASIDFTSIPATFDDLIIELSGRQGYQGVRLQFNGDTAANYSWKALKGDGSTAQSESNATYGAPYNTFIYVRCTPTTTDTANVFGSADIYIPQYASANSKVVSADGVTENNATAAAMSLTAGLWSGTAAINRVTLTPDSGSTFVQYSMASLYGIKNS